MLSAPALLSLTILLCLISTEAQVAYDNCEPLTLGMSLAWKLDTAANGIYYKLIGTSASTREWLGIGAAKRTGSMTGADATIGYTIDGTSFNIADYFLESQNNCNSLKKGVCLDSVLASGSNGVSSPAGTFTGGTLSLEWFKSLTAGDSYDIAINPAVSTSMVYARGSVTGANVIDQHATASSADKLITFGRTPALNCPISTCGNGAINAANGEQCDGGTQCTNCRCNTGFVSTSPVSRNCESPCGNGRIDAGEQCDGGALCGSNCVCTGGSVPTFPATTSCSVLCGNAIVNSGEQCDGGTGCGNCICSTGFSPASPVARDCIPNCGNGKIDTGEQCDGGAQCTGCLCNTGYQSTSPVSVACVVIPTTPPGTPPSTPGTPPGPSPPSGLTRREQILAEGYSNSLATSCDLEVFWKPVLETDDSVSIALLGATTGWISIGFPADDRYRMIGSDSVLGYCNTREPNAVTSYYLSSQEVSGLTPNSAMPITDTKCTEADGSTTIYFTRTFNSGSNPITDPGQVPVIFASNDADTLQEHLCKVRSGVLSLYNSTMVATDEGPEDYENAHGILMIAAFGFIFELGIFVGRYARDLTEHWFYIHVGLQAFAIMIASVAIIVIFAMTEDGGHFGTVWHAQFGIAIFGLSWVQIVMGIFRPHVPKDGDSKTFMRKVFEILHPNIGRVIVIAAIVNIFCGINEIGWHFWVYIFYGVCVGIFILAAIILEWRKMQSGTDSKT